MESFECESHPFFTDPDSAAGYFHGYSLSRNRLPVVIKRLDLPHLHHKSTQQRLSQCLNSALTQAKVQHSHSCDILELQVEFDKNSCTVYQVLESLQGQLTTDIAERRNKQQGYSEKELWRFLLQMAGAVALAHSKGIAHRDIRPAQIFRTEDRFKLGNFGCFVLRRDGVYPSKGDEHYKYMSPQLRTACLEGTKCSGFKADVYSLAATTLELAALPAQVNPERREQAVEDLHCSSDLKALLKAMLAPSELARPTMQEVASASTVPISPLTRSPSVQQPLFPDPPKALAYVETDKLQLWDLDQQTWLSTPLQSSVVADIGSRYVWKDTELFISGGWGGETSRREAYEVSLGGAVTRLADMMIPRRSHGLWWLASKESVLVFGGSAYTGYSNTQLRHRP